MGFRRVVWEFLYTDDTKEVIAMGNNITVEQLHSAKDSWISVGPDSQPQCEEDINIADHYVEREQGQEVLKEDDGDTVLTVKMKTSNKGSDFVAGLIDKCIEKISQ